MLIQITVFSFQDQTPFLKQINDITKYLCFKLHMQTDMRP